jgi:tape measure domain-containing protein
VADVYTIRAEDGVSGPAAKMATAYARVAVTAGALASAMRSGDAEQLKFARSAAALAGAELRAARAVISAGQAVDKLNPKVERAAIASKKAAAGTKGFSYTLNGLANAASNAAFNLAGKLASGLFDVGKELYDTAALASRTKLGFKTLFGGVEQGAAATDKAIELSRKFGISIEDVASAMTMFKGANFDMDQIEGLIKLGADMRSLGSTTEQVTSAMLAFRKIQSQGFLQGDELNMLSEAGVSIDKIYTKLQTTLGKTREEIVKMQGNRQLMAGDVLNAAAEAILGTAGSTKFGEAGEKAANETIDGITSRLKANLGDDVFEAVLKAEPALVKGLSAVLGGTLGADGSSVKDQLTVALERVGKGLEDLAPKIPSLVENLGKIATLLGQVVERILEPQKGIDAVGRLGFSEDSIPGQILGLNGNKIGEFIQGVWQSATQGRGDPYARGQEWSEGLAKGITDGAPSVGAAAGSAAQGAIDATRETTKTHSPSQVAFELGQNWTEGTALGIEDQAAMAARASATVADQVVAESGGALGQSGGAFAAGQAAGDTINHSASSGASIGAVHFDVHLGGVSADGDQVQQLRDFVELEMTALLERAMQGSGA